MLNFISTRARPSSAAWGRRRDARHRVYAVLERLGRAHRRRGAVVGLWESRRAPLCSSPRDGDVRRDVAPRSVHVVLERGLRGRRSRPGNCFGDTEAALRAKTSHSARDEHDRSSCERQLCTSTGPASEPTYNYLESMRAVHIKHQRREMGMC